MQLQGIETLTESLSKIGIIGICYDNSKKDSKFFVYIFIRNKLYQISGSNSIGDENVTVRSVNKFGVPSKSENTICYIPSNDEKVTFSLKTFSDIPYKDDSLMLDKNTEILFSDLFSICLEKQFGLIINKDAMKEVSYYSFIKELI